MKKTNPIHGHLPKDKTSNNQLNAELPQVFKLGLDVDIKQVVAAVQCDHGVIKPASSFAKEKLVDWVKGKVTQGHAVWTVYESCGFGYLKGTVSVSSSANIIDGAVIDLDGPTKKTMRSDGTGFYGAAELLPGNYTLVTANAGYHLRTNQITIVAGKVTSQDVLLEAK